MKHIPPGIKPEEEAPANGVIQSLCYLYHEALKHNLRELADIIQRAIEQGEHAIQMDVALSSDRGDALKQFYVLRGFSALDDVQQALFLREIERIRTK